MATPQSHLFYTVDEYLMLERTTEERHEYLDGFVYAMAGERIEHGDICTNLSRILSTQLMDKPCRTLSKDMKVRSGPLPQSNQSKKGLYSYPDIIVVCGEPQFHDRYLDVLVNPNLIIEVLSDSTEAFDRGEKFLRYRTWLPSLTDYLLVSQTKPLIEHYQRQDNNRWTMISVEGLEGELTLESINCRMPLREVYERIVFPASIQPPASAGE